MPTEADQATVKPALVGVAEGTGDLARPARRALVVRRQRGKGLVAQAAHQVVVEQLVVVEHLVFVVGIHMNIN